MNKSKTLLFLFFLCGTQDLVKAEDGYRLWLRYDLISDSRKLTEYRESIRYMMIDGTSSAIGVARTELDSGLRGLLGIDVPHVSSIKDDGIVLAGAYHNTPLLATLGIGDKLKQVGSEGYVIISATLNGRKAIVITANNDIGVLYGVFRFLQLLQTHHDIGKLEIVSSPKIKLRVLNHWDNLDRTVERGYAGFSLWEWHRLPDYIDPRYRDYARANSSIGINGAALTNVNANAFVLTPSYLEKVAALANVFRPYGIRVYLTARFSAPIEIGGLKTADPLDIQVQEWWKSKAQEIYSKVPDFGGFLVKANSEGQPGPQNYGRTHADGANMLADAVRPFGGVVMWRAFVYDNNVPVDRVKQAYNEFKPLDGTFRDNVLIQVKNGPLDFQPREPFHPLFGAMPKTPLMMEFQITQEYLGQATQLVYLSTMWKEVLDSDTHARGTGSTVARVIDGSLENHALTGIAGVANTGTDRNWTGHLFGQANWYAFGRLAWNHELSSQQIAEEWTRMTFSNDQSILWPMTGIMMASRENAVNYMTPLGLHHIMGWSHHYGPAPWIKEKNRADWTSVYYHRADTFGIGFDRTAGGSDAVAQYFPTVAQKFASLDSCPSEFLLWFHRVKWDYRMKSGKTLWDELCYHYYDGVEAVRKMQTAWHSLKGRVDDERFEHVQSLLRIQENEAVWWRNACVLYFQTLSRKPIPAGLEKPDNSLQYYESLSFPYAPGN